MKNIQLIDVEKHRNSQYELIEDKIYKNTEEAIYVFAINFDLEEEEDSQYPLEDVLDKFYLHVSDFLDEDAFYSSKNISLELAGELADVQNAIQSIIGKRVYNSEYIGEDGITYVKVVIE
ncbi:hypothetical protein H9Q08_14355 [Chryseobacterium sp. PS-8]|uniref:Uncharacterized protein n=1 Tax=Chryseobacterium indicum TaxID=2766954 RepID=A0ABS9C7R2_9FLAO|nr:hypothetical protein [Chryseobacterium sp. PS-8]MCF2220466.1 hypothetical protein [Chryseobacterium sp. PS-8]